MQCRQTFKYRPLDTSKRQIRLVRLTSIDETREDPAFSIEHHDIDSVPPFKALSYCWGEHMAATPIELNGCSMQIYRSLYQFLKTVQSQVDQSYYWIDQLCINQHDNIEKSDQVAMMGTIYTRATETVVSLHTGSFTDQTFNVMDALSAVLCATDHDSDVKHRFRPWLDSHPDAVRCFLENPYWNRMWIVQEILLANKVVIACTRGSFQFTRIFLIESYLESNYPALSKTILWLTSEFGWGMGGRVSPAWHGKRFELGYILHHCQGRQCRDDKDKIYALQGVVLPDQRIKVDYDLSLEEIAEQVVAMIIRSKSPHFSTLRQKVWLCLYILDHLFPALRISFRPERLPTETLIESSDDLNERLIRDLVKLFVHRSFSKDGSLLPSS